MSMSLGRRRAQSGLAGARGRLVPAESHSGTYQDFLSRHETEANSMTRATRQQRREFVQRLYDRVIDDRNLRLAIEHVATKGGSAPGPNGLNLRKLDDRETWDLAHALRTLLRSGQYEHGPVRTTLIPKGRGRGTRPIRLANQDDRAVGRGVVQIIQPVIDPLFGNLSFGSRPRRGRDEATAAAERLALDNHQWTWVTEDLRDAFENVPRTRLLQVVRYHLPDDRLVELVSHLIGGAAGRGIPQGNPLSPLLLNIYLDWLLDRPWRRASPEIPLLRNVDDVLLLCRNRQEAQDAYRDLQRITRDATMTLKGTADTSIRDMEADQTAEWLGYGLGKEADGLRVHLTETCWEKLEDNLHLASEAPEAPLLGHALPLEWIAQQGAAYPSQHGDVRRIYAEVTRRAQGMGFEEIPSLAEFTECWSRGNRRWQRARRETLLGARTGAADGSARQHDDTATVSRRDGGVPALGTPPTFSTASTALSQVTIYCDGSLVQGTGIGGWAYLVVDQGGHSIAEEADSLPRTTSNRAELIAVIKALRSLAEPSRVQLVLDSRYVHDGITELLPRWKARGWRRSKGGRVANVQLWQQLEELLRLHEVRSRWTRGHSGEPGNEYVDRRARQAGENHAFPSCGDYARENQ